ncbi:hypothetical protein PRNP1_014580 [Phytophthora ramorum]
MQATPSLEVASATFLRPECGHAQLFHPEYKRSNRTKGLKILRCFPHCCPEHIDRSYCGASLSRASFPTSMDGRYAPVYDAGHRVKRQRASTRSLRSVGNSGLLQDKLRWEHANSSTVAISRNLALLYSFLRWTPLNVYASFVDELVHLLHHNLKESLSGFSNRISRLNCFSKLIFNQVEADQATAVASSFIHGSRIPSRSPSTLTPEMGRLLYALTQATLWLFSTRTRQWIRSFIMKHAESVLNKYALRASFVMFVQKFEDRLNQQVFKRTELRSVDNVAEEIISAVYAHEYFHARRPNVREILSGQNFAGWHVFVAQMRQTYINSSACPGVPRAFVRRQPTLSFGEAHPPRNSAENAWNAEWILDVDEAVWKFSEAVTKDIGEGPVGIAAKGAFKVLQSGYLTFCASRACAKVTSLIES